MKYQNKKSGKVLEFVKEENGTYFLTDGQQEQKFSTSTFKRWWKKVEEPQQNQEVASDGTPFTEVMEEIVAGAEEKAKEAQTATVESILNDMIQSGKKVFISDAMKAIADAGLQTDVKFVTDFLMNGGVVEEKKEKKQKKEKKEVKKNNLPVEDTIEMVNNLLDSMGIARKNAERNVSVANSAGKRVLDFWKRKNRVRVYINPELVDYEKFNKELAEDISPNPNGSSKLSISAYIQKENIEQAVKQLVSLIKVVEEKKEVA